MSGGKSSIPSQVIYTPEKVLFMAGGTYYDVSYINFALATGSVPTCEVGIAPSRASGKIRINSLDLVSLKTAFTKLSKDAVDHVKTSIYAKLVSNTKVFPNQELYLKDWILVSVGMNQISSTAEFQLSCVMAHPAIQMQFHVGCFFNGAGVLHLEKEADKVQNPINAATQAITATETANKTKIKTICEPMSTASTPLKDPNEIKSELEKGMSEMKSLIPKLIHWDSSYTKGSLDIPCKDIGDPVPYGVKYALVESWVPPVKQQSFWDILVGVANSFYFDVLPTYHETYLTAAPSNPYGGPAVKLPDRYVYNLDMPGFDPDPTYGVIMYQGQGTSGSSDGVTFTAQAQAGAVLQPVNIAYIPAESKLSGGTLIHSSDPAWIDTAMTKAASRCEVRPRASANSSYSPPKDDQDNIDKKIKANLFKWNQLRLRHLGTSFMLSYRQNMTAGMQCALCLKFPDGSEPIPGSVLSFMSNGELFKGKIVTVTHNIDCGESRAVTTIRLAWCDVDKGSSNVLGSSPVVPFYNAVQVSGGSSSSNSGGMGPRK